MRQATTALYDDARLLRWPPSQLTSPDTPTPQLAKRYPVHLESPMVPPNLPQPNLLHIISTAPGAPPRRP